MIVHDLFQKQSGRLLSDPFCQPALLRFLDPSDNTVT